MDISNVEKKLCNAANCTEEDFRQKYEAWKKAEEDFKTVYEPIKEKMISMYADGKLSAKNLTLGGVRLTYVSPSVRHTIDSKKLKEEEPEIAKKFTKATNVSATVKLG